MDLDFSAESEIEGSKALADSRSKSSLRIHYEAQVQVIRSQIGGLEKAREGLGLSQRKISQLLLVDPSAWTRWVREGENAPPHIWRALQWYLSLKERIPGLTPQYFLHSETRFLGDKTSRHQQKIDAEVRKRQLDELKEKIKDLESSLLMIEVLKAETKSLRKWNALWLFVGVTLSIWILLLLM